MIQQPLPINRNVWLSLFLLSAATLTFEITLTRLFSVAQFYHFAFMIVSIALLGFGASGTALTIFPSLQHGALGIRLAQWSLGVGISILAAYLLTNWLPFDSYSIVWDSRQVFILLLHYVALAAPFFFSGLALGRLLTSFPEQAGTSYAVNLLGSAGGCVLALLAPAYLGGEGLVTLSCLLALLAAGMLILRLRPLRLVLLLVVLAVSVFSGIDLGLRLTRDTGLSVFALHISPYKSLSYALQNPGAQVIYRQWNAFSRVDVVRSRSIHALPGLSYRFLDPLPALDGLLVDGDDLNPIVPSSADSAFTDYLPAASAFHLRPHGDVLILEPRGGLDIFNALNLSSGEVTCVEVNPMVIAAVPIYTDPRLTVYQESERSFLQRSQEKYDVILLSLTSSFHPVQSGAYTLAEDYRYTVEAFQDMLSHLRPDGLLVATRWLQDPPSEDLRLFALAVTALEAAGGDPTEQIVAFRGYNTVTVLVKNSAFTPSELIAVRKYTSARAFDLTYAPDIQTAETNQYNILPESRYYQTYLSFIESDPRQVFYDSYAYDVRPPSDDHPFFGHYFTWEQAPEILAVFGKAWLPFGGSGYFVILALLLLALVLACVLILLPVGLRRLSSRRLTRAASPFILPNLLYFGLLGFAFLLVEIPLLQRFILYLGSPAFAVTTVLFSLLFFSGLGSRWNEHLPLRPALAVLVVLTLLMPSLLTPLFSWTLGLPFASRLGMTIIALAPLGFLMGIPFPAGLRLLATTPGHSAVAGSEPSWRGDIPWIWAVNGAASVIAPIVAALMALNFGFSDVLRVGALCYFAALITVWVSLRPRALGHPLR